MSRLTTSTIELVAKQRTSDTVFSDGHRVQAARFLKQEMPR